MLKSPRRVPLRHLMVFLQSGSHRLGRRLHAYNVLLVCGEGEAPRNVRQTDRVFETSDGMYLHFYLFIFQFRGGGAILPYHFRWRNRIGAVKRVAARVTNCCPPHHFLRESGNRCRGLLGLSCSPDWQFSMERRNNYRCDWRRHIGAGVSFHEQRLFSQSHRCGGVCEEWLAIYAYPSAPGAIVWKRCYLSDTGAA